MSTNYPQYPLTGPSYPSSPQPALSQDVVPTDRWAANMLLVIQAVQRLHAAFDNKFIRSKSNP